jgi:Tol biopolymer transport system component
MKCVLFFIALGFSFASGAQSSIRLTALDSPGIFAPGIISDGFSNRDMAISPDGNDLFYTLQWTTGGIFSVILHSKKINGVWTKPETAWFSGRFNDLEPAFSPEGDRLFFTSNRPMNDADSSKDYDIWYLEKKTVGWEGPFNMGPPVNTEKDEFYASVAKNGNLYFTRDNGDAKDDIFFAAFRNGKYELPVPLPSAVNSKGYDFNSFVDPEEKYIIFSSYKRSDDLGGGDLYYSLHSNGVWLSAVHFGSAINSPSLDYSPFVSPDHQYFFFTSKRQLIRFPFPVSKSANEIMDLLNSCGNGNDDIYIMNFKVVEETMQGK